MRRILLADDSVTIQKVVELTFMEEDYSVVSVSNGTEALEKLDETAPDLLIADVHMPGANGYEVCRTAKEKRPDVPVLLLVGTFEPFDEDEAQAAGADGYLKKPFDSQELLRRVDELLSDGEDAQDEVMAEPAPAGDDHSTMQVQPEPESLDDIELAEEGMDLDESLESPFEVTLQDEDSATFEHRTADIDALQMDSEDAPTKAFAMASSAGEEEAFELEGDGEALEVDDVEALDLEEEGEDLEVEDEPQEEVPSADEETRVVERPGESPALSDEDVERVARRVVAILGQEVLREVAWEVVPDLAEVVIKARIRELESHLE